MPAKRARASWSRVCAARPIFEQEYQMAHINQGIWSELETVLIPASAQYQHVSSTMAREMIRYHQPLEQYLPAPVAEKLKGR